MPTAPKTLAHDSLLASPPKDRMAQIVREIVEESRAHLSSVASAHHEALMNSLAVSPADSFVTSDAPYGQNPFAASHAKDRTIGDQVSGFSAEQTNSITTRLAQPLLGQREVLYIEAQGAEDQIKARTQERLWDLAIHSRWTSWADLVWRSMRDVTTRSRAYWRVAPLRVIRRRRVYIYGDPIAMQKLVDEGLPPEEVAAISGTIRTSAIEPVTLWDGPVLSSVPFGLVHKDRSEPLITDSSLFTVEERHLPYQQFLLEGRAMFPTGSEVPFDPTSITGADPASLIVDQAIGAGSTVPDASTRFARIYEPVRFYEFRGVNPIGSPEVEKLAWITDGATVGSKDWDGSGACVNLVEWCWDPITGMALSASPIMLVRTLQEMLSLLSNCGLSAALWNSFPGGGVNTDVVASLSQVQNLRPHQFFKLSGEGQAIQPIQLGKDSQTIEQLMRSSENAARLVTAGGSSVVGTSPQGVETLGEYAGLTQGLLDRIGTQSEINADVALRRAFGLVTDIWRDSLATDVDLQSVLGQNEDTIEATLEALDGRMDVIPMAARYHQVRQATVTAITALLDRAQGDPQLMARLKPEVYDALAYAIGGPESRRWYRSGLELMAQGIDPNMLQQQAIANASQPQSVGKPSPPKDQPATGADVVNQQGAM